MDCPHNLYCEVKHMGTPEWSVLDRTAYLIEHTCGPQDLRQMGLPAGTGTVLLIVLCGSPPAPGRDAVVAQLQQ